MTEPAHEPEARSSVLRRHARRVARLGLAPAALYLLLYVLFTWPAVTHARTRLLCDEGDGLQNVWNFWWLEKAADEGRSPFYTDVVHHPFGTSLRGHTLGLWNATVAWPLRAALTREQAYNAVLVLSFVACGVTAFLLAYRLTGSWPGALAGGFVFTFSHWHLARGLGHLNLVAAQWLPLFALAWLRLLDRPTLGAAALAAGALLLATLTDLYFLVACAMLGVLLLAGRALDVPDGVRAWVTEQARARALLGFGALALLATAPLVLPLLDESARDPFHVFLDDEARKFSADLLGLVVPGSTWRFGEVTQPVWSRYPLGAANADVALGLPVLLLVGWVWRRRADVAGAVRVRAWALTLVAIVLLSLGPSLQVAGRDTGLPLPWAALDWLPPLKLSGKPVRFLVVATVASSVLVAAGVALLHARGQRAALVVFGLALLVDHCPRPLPTTSLEVPAYVRTLAAEREGALLDLSCGLTRPLWHQTLHERPLAFGYLSRIPSSVYEQEQPLIAAHARGDWATLRARFGIRWLAVAPGSPPANVAALRLVVADDVALLYELPGP